MTGQGVTELKDMLWKAINDENNRIDTSDITHRPLDGHHRVREEDDFIIEYQPSPDEIDEEAEDLRKISAEQWGEEYDWDDADYEDNDMDDVDGADEDDDRATDDEAFRYEAINDDDYDK